jgi:phosphoribosyl-dephospho-CoA transferase
MFSRHQLVEISAAGREYLYQNRLSFAAPVTDDVLRQLIIDGVAGVLIPGIVKRQDDPRTGFIEIGMAFPIRVEEMRVRAFGHIPEDAVTGIISPYEVAARYQGGNSAREQLITKLLDLCQQLGIKAGLFGSSALAVVTGLPYCHDGSDIDLYVSCNDPAALEQLFVLSRQLEADFGVRADIEVELPDGFAVKLKELYSSSFTVMAKGLFTVELFDKEDAFAMLQKNKKI